VTAFLDTSIVVRYVTNDPPHLADISAAIIEGDEDLTITGVAIAETAHVLRSVYALPREAIVDALMLLLRLQNIDTFEFGKPLVIQALLMSRPSGRVSLPDALIWAAARAAGDATVYSLDRHFPADGIEVRDTP
jgi:predicted nucleic acid-binding protein